MRSSLRCCAAALSLVFLPALPCAAQGPAFGLGARLSMIRTDAHSSASPERFTGFTVDVSADCVDADLARKLITVASRACQVMNTLRLSAPVEISYQGAPIESAEAVA